MRKIYAIAAVTSLGALNSAQVSASGDGRLQSWLIDSCPASPVETPRAVPEALIGLGIDFLIDKVGTAIKEAADKDKAGEAINGVNGSYLYWYTAPNGTDKPVKSAKATPASCLVIAIADSVPEKWCSQEPFKGSGVCAEDKSGTRVSKLHDIEGRLPLREVATGTKLPRLYAEISLSASTDGTAIAPEIRALYYPRSLSAARKFSGAKPRDLLITASAANPAGEPALGTVAVQLRDLVPNARLITAESDTGKAVFASSVAPIWIPMSRFPKDAAIRETDGYVFPVNISAEVREVGDPSVLLQTFAKIFDAQKEDLRSGLKKEFMPSVAASTSQTAAAASAELLTSYSGAVTAALNAQAEYEAVCADPKSATDTARQHFLSVIATQATAESLAAKLENPQTVVKFNPRFGPSSNLLSASDLQTLCRLARKK